MWRRSCDTCVSAHGGTDPLAGTAAAAALLGRNHARLGARPDEGVSHEPGYASLPPRASDALALRMSSRSMAAAASLRA